MSNRLLATRLAATIDRGFGINGETHEQESNVRGYQLE
jgi:hypothetical protein